MLMEKKGDLFQKLFNIKAKLPKISKDAKGYGYTYATLGNIQAILKEPFEEQGLLIVHKIQDNKLITEIVDVATGEILESSIEMGTIETTIIKDLYKDEKYIGKSEEKVSVDPQGLGSAITYYRRYNLLALLDLEVDDDDGAEVSGKAKANQYNQETPKKWLNYQDFEKMVNSGINTEQAIALEIKKQGFSLSNNAKNAIRHYVETGELDKNLFFNKK